MDWSPEEINSFVAEVFPATAGNGLYRVKGSDPDRLVAFPSGAYALPD